MDEGMKDEPGPYNDLPVVMRQLLAGNARADIEEALAEAGEKDPTAVVEAALAIFAEVAQQPKDVRLGFCQELARDLIKRMLDVGDLAGALAALKEYARLADVYSQAKGSKLPKDIPEPAVAVGTEAEALLALVKGKA